MDLPVYFLPVLGVFVGILVTLIGGGGGAIYIPLLMFGFGLSFKQAVPISLATMIITSLFGTISHYRQDHLHLKGGMLAVAGALIGTGIGTYIGVIASEVILQRAFGVLMLILTYPMYLEMRSIESIDGEESEKKTLREINILEHPFSHGFFITTMIFIIGLFSGISAGLFGVSGVVSLIVGFYLIKIKPKIIVGTSVFILFFKALSGFLWHIPLMEVNLRWDIILLLGLGTSTGGLLGPWLLSIVHHKRAEQILEIIFVVIVAGIGFVFLFKPI